MHVSVLSRVKRIAGRIDVKVSEGSCETAKRVIYSK